MICSTVNPCIARPISDTPTTSFQGQSHEFLENIQPVLAYDVSPPTTMSPSSKTARSLQLRSPGFQSFLNFENGWNLYYSSWNSIALPIQPSAWALSQLYSSIVIKAHGSWRSGPPQHGIGARYGDLELWMFCVEEPIPWDFVVKFASELLRTTEDGWAGLYRLMLSNAAEGLTVFVRLGVEGS